ncbi:sigma-54-dependent transcriptional regulator [Sphingomonas sp. PAMC 26621]|uniref:sigma-54-dependent transcriptional regulator n=1 Tax=Sphingomonas sp. PAMC 26621 TaxID=1112213 RepID=UPI000288C49E|nr:sigma 54-interacting transcriptional regulator [Sphingomonas sp. PAMC 26621]
MAGAIVRMLLVGPADGAFHVAAGMARDAGAEVATATTVAAALDCLRQQGAALVMIDVAADVCGFLADLAAERFAVPVIACGIDASAARAVAAIRAGARDYVPLPPDRDLIAAAIREIAALPAGPLIGDHPSFTRALDFARAMGPSHAPILLTGERGTGKERVAQAIHQAGRGMGSFVTIECAGVAPDILEYELFGHDGTAFPSARAGRRGAMTTARGGTVFLRDIDVLPAPLQTRLLGGLEDPGAPRLIASARRALDPLVEAGRFRADLLARFALATIVLPPLRARGGDLALLARSFATASAAAEGRTAPTLSDDTCRLLCGYGWPGNVAELQEVMHRAVLLGAGPEITPPALVLADGSSLAATAGSANGPAEMDALVGRTVEDVERDLILLTLERCRGNRTSASQILGISVRTMRNKLRAFVEAGIPVTPAL